MSKFKIDADDLKHYADGNWQNIIGHFMPDMATAAASANRSKHFDCPFPERHAKSGGRKKFRFSTKNAPWNGGAICSCGSWGGGFGFLMDAMGWDFPTALAEVNDYLGDPCGAGEKSSRSEADRAAFRKKREQEAKERLAQRRAEQEKADKAAAARLHRVWGESISILDPDAKPAWDYLRSRAIDIRVLERLTEVVRFHPALTLYDDDGKCHGDHPAVLSLFQDSEDRPVSIHRIYLTQEGKKVEIGGQSAKKLMPYPSYLTTRGGAMRYGKAPKILGVAEGIETALAVTTATKLVTWPCYNDSLLAGIDVAFLKEQGVKLLLVWEDKDVSKAGEEAGKTLQSRAWEAGIMCQRMVVPHAIPGGAKSIDWNDVLATYGQNGFPSIDIGRIIEENKGKLPPAAITA